MVDALQEMLDGGIDRIPAIGGDVADPDQREKAYDATPLRRCSAWRGRRDEFRDDLGKIACPVLIMNSPQDHVVEPVNSDILAAGVSGPVERVTLERSYHVATLDYDKDLVSERAVEFARKVTVDLELDLTSGSGGAARRRWSARRTISHEKLPWCSWSQRCR